MNKLEFFIFSRQKMAAYTVSWSPEIKSNDTNKLLDP